MDRAEFHEILCSILGSRNVYFQPPPTIKMKYPAIVYSLEDISNEFANNTPYKQDVKYLVTSVSEQPDSDVITKLSQLAKTRFSRHYTSDLMNHDVFVIYI